MSLPLRQETQVVLRRGEGKRKPQPFYEIGQSPKVGGSNPPLQSGEQWNPRDTTGDGQPVPNGSSGGFGALQAPQPTFFNQLQAFGVLFNGFH
jgi:hypothetical protein